MNCLDCLFQIASGKSCHFDCLSWMQNAKLRYRCMVIKLVRGDIEFDIGWILPWDDRLLHYLIMYPPADFQDIVSILCG